MRNILYVLVILALITGVLAVAFIYSTRAKRRQNTSWQQLLRRLTLVDRDNLALVALDLIHEDGSLRETDWPELSSDQIWMLIDGLPGLEKIEANCDVFIDIAAYIQVTYPEAVVIAEELRRNTRHIKWHVERLRSSARNGHAVDTFAAYAQRAVASYYLMRGQLLALCEQTQFGGLDQLRAAI